MSYSLRSLPPAGGRRLSWAVLILSLIPLTPIQAAMQLMPPVQEIEVQRGYPGTFGITVRNTGDEDVPCRFSAHDMDVTVEGRPFIADSSYARGCGQWIELEPAECIIKPHESLTLQGTVKVPRTAEGSYYALIKGSFVGMTIPMSDEVGEMGGSQLGIESEAMVALILTVPSSRNKPMVVPDTLIVYPRGRSTEEGHDATLDFEAGSGNGWTLVMAVRNDGNVHARVTGEASIWNEAGTRVGSAAFRAGKGYVLPGKIRNLTATGDNILGDGYYMLRVALHRGDYSSLSSSMAFAVYEGDVYAGASCERIAELLKASSPGFTLKEPFQQQKITPGGSSYMAVHLISTASDTLRLIPRTLEWNLNDMGQPTLGDELSLQPRSCSGWIEFPEDRITLLPGKRRSLKLKIRSPRDISGEYYSAIVFDPEQDRRDLPAEFMAARTQLLAVTTPAGLDYGVEVDTVRVVRHSTPDLTLYRFMFRVENVGNVHCFASGSMGLEKEVVSGVYEPVGTTWSFGDQQTIILPGGRRVFEVDIPAMEKGNYRVILAVNYGREFQPVMKYQRVEIQ